MANRIADPKKQKRTRDLIASAAKGKRPHIDFVIPREALPKQYTDQDIQTMLANVVLYGTHRWYIGRIDLPFETKIEWDGVYCKDRWIEFNGVLSHPDIDGILADVNDCLAAAVAAAILAGLVNLGAATAAFQSSLVACLTSKGVQYADEITIYIESSQQSGSWHYCL